MHKAMRAVGFVCMLAMAGGGWTGCQSTRGPVVNWREWANVTALDESGQRRPLSAREAMVIAAIRDRYGELPPPADVWVVDVAPAAWRGASEINGRWEITQDWSKGGLLTRVRWCEKERPDRYFVRELSQEESHAWQQLVTNLRIDERPPPRRVEQSPLRQRLTWFHLSAVAGRVLTLDVEPKRMDASAEWEPERHPRQAHAEVMILLHQIGSHDLLQARYPEMLDRGVTVAFGTAGSRVKSVAGTANGELCLNVTSTGYGESPGGWCILREGRLQGGVPEPVMNGVNPPVPEAYAGVLESPVMAGDYLVGKDAGGKLVIVHVKDGKRVTVSDPATALQYVPVRYYASRDRVLLVYRALDAAGKVTLEDFCWLNPATGVEEETGIIVPRSLPAQPHGSRKGYAWLPELYPPQHAAQRHGQTSVRPVRTADWSVAGPPVVLPFLAEAVWVDEANDAVFAVWDGVLWRAQAPRGWAQPRAEKTAR